jgi:hypothetical protein
MRYIWLTIFIVCPGILLQLGQPMAAVLMAGVLVVIEFTLRPGLETKNKNSDRDP